MDRCKWCKGARGIIGPVEIDGCVAGRIDPFYPEKSTSAIGRVAVGGIGKDDEQLAVTTIEGLQLNLLACQLKPQTARRLFDDGHPEYGG